LRCQDSLSARGKLDGDPDSVEIISPGELDADALVELDVAFEGVGVCVFAEASYHVQLL